FKTLEPFLKQMTTMDKFDKIVADAGYGSEYNYSMLEEEYSDKQYYITYTMYEKEQPRKYQNDPTKLANWFYDEEDDYYLDQNGVRFSFKCYSRRKDKSTGQVRDFKVYEADKFQLTPELERLAKTKSGRQRQVRYNSNWQYLKEKAKGVLQSPDRKKTITTLIKTALGLASNVIVGVKINRLVRFAILRFTKRINFN